MEERGRVCGGRVREMSELTCNFSSLPASDTMRSGNNKTERIVLMLIENKIQAEMPKEKICPTIMKNM